MELTGLCVGVYDDEDAAVTGKQSNGAYQAKSSDRNIKLTNCVSTAKPPAKKKIQNHTFLSVTVSPIIHFPQLNLNLVIKYCKKRKDPHKTLIRHS